jgi:hypothetical protein
VGTYPMVSFYSSAWAIGTVMPTSAGAEIFCSFEAFGARPL